MLEALEFNERSVDAIARLVHDIGVPGIAVLILCVGIAMNLPNVLESLRGIARDYREDKRKARELEHRISRDAALISLEISRRKANTSKAISEGVSKE